MSKTQQTLIIVKPDGVGKGISGEVLSRFEKAGLKIIAMEMLKLSRPFVSDFYAHLKTKIPEKTLSATLDFMTSGNVVMAIFEGEDAIKKARAVCGPTNPAQAPAGTIRGDFSNDDLIENTKRGIATRNVVHASSSVEEAQTEIEMAKKIMKSIK